MTSRIVAFGVAIHSDAEAILRSEPLLHHCHSLFVRCDAGLHGIECGRRNSVVPVEVHIANFDIVRFMLLFNQQSFAFCFITHLQMREIQDAIKF